MVKGRKICRSANFLAAVGKDVRPRRACASSDQKSPDTTRHALDQGPQPSHTTTCCMGWGIVFDVHKVTSKHTRRPWQYLIPQDLDVPMLFMAPSTTTSSLLSPKSIAHNTMADGPRFRSLSWTQASISLSPCLRRTRTRPSLWYRENRDSSLQVSPLSEVPQSVPPPLLTAASPVLHSEPRTSGWTPRPISGSQKPSPNDSN